MKNYNLDKLNNRIPSIGKPDKMGNVLPAKNYNYDTITRANKPKPSARENLTSPSSLSSSALSTALQESTKLMKN